MFKRYFLFAMVNILIMVTLSIFIQLLGLEPYINSYGLNYGSLAIMCLIWGMGGAFISLFLSKQIVKWQMGLKIIDPNTHDRQARELVQMVDRLSKRAGLKKCPEVGWYESPEVNAFATGASASSSLVAVSTGLLENMNQEEVEGVLGHEVAHIANGDMITMTLLQGVMNAFVMFLARVIAAAVARGGDNERPNFAIQFGVTIALQILFGILASIVVRAFSRYREYRADAGGAKVAGKDKMLAALRRLAKNYEMVDTADTAMASLKINGKRSGFAALFSTHPDINDRIQRLERAQ